MATPEPARPASPLKTLSFGCRGCPKPAVCIPCQDVKTMGFWPRALTGSAPRLWARLSAITRARRWLMPGYRRPIWLRERPADQGLDPAALVGGTDRQRRRQPRSVPNRVSSPLNPHLASPKRSLVDAPPWTSKPVRPRSSLHRCVHSGLPAVGPQRMWRAAVRSLPMPRRAQ